MEAGCGRRDVFRSNRARRAGIKSDVCSRRGQKRILGPRKPLPSLGPSVALLPSSLRESRYHAACRWTGVWRTNWNKDKRDGVSEWVSNGCTRIRERWGFFSVPRTYPREGWFRNREFWLVACCLAVSTGAKSEFYKSRLSQTRKQESRRQKEHAT